MNPFITHHVRQVRRPKRLARGPVMKLSRRVRDNYANELKNKIFIPWREATQRLLIDKLAGIEHLVEAERPGGLRADAVRLDTWADDVNGHINTLSTEYDNLSKQSHDIALGVFKEVNSESHRQWYAGAKRVLGVDLTTYEPWLNTEAKAFVSENGTLITKTKAETIGNINRIVMQGFRNGKRWESLSDEILDGTDLQQGIFSKLDTRADLIARDQTSKLWGNLNEKRQTNAGIELYRWRTAEDERVRGTPGGTYPDARPSHFVMDGKYCSWKDPTVYAETLEEAMAGKWRLRTSIGGALEHPGQPINCRCYAEAVFQTLYAEATL